MAFYADFAPQKVRLSNYILRFSHHFDQYLNARLVRSIGYEQIVWC